MEFIRGKQKKAMKVVLYGVEGIGKSTFASKFPKPVFIDIEDSTTTMDVVRTPKPTSWNLLLEQVKYLKEHKEFETLVIDTADWAEMLCHEHICAKHNVDGIEGIGYGKGYVYAAEEFGKLLDLLTDCTEQGMHVVVLAHSTIQKFEQPDEMGAYDRYTLKLSKKNAPLLKEWGDMVLFANYETFTIKDSATNKLKAQGSKRVMYTERAACWEAKNRFGLKEKLPFDFKEIEHLFAQKETKSEKKVPISVVEEPKEELTEPSTADPFKGLPQTVIDLMRHDEVKPEELHGLCVEKGYVTVDTPFAHYPDNLLKNIETKWDSLCRQVKENRLPFEV